MTRHFLTGVWSQVKLEQSDSQVKRPGETVKMSCVISGYTMFSMSLIMLLLTTGSCEEMPTDSNY
uniref:Ig-like domain-containing protein n=1 Tax=Poecilia mexicana TaxID=48701 RepID=A0A3B3WYN6_9TELE